MDHAAGTARQHHHALRLDAFNRQTERMHRPTLLEKSSAANYLCHYLPSRERGLLAAVRKTTDSHSRRRLNQFGSHMRRESLHVNGFGGRTADIPTFHLSPFTSYLLRLLRPTPVDCFRILLERPKDQHQQQAKPIGEHAGIEQCRPGSIRRPVARQLLLVDKFAGEDQHGKRQRQSPACPRPSVGATGNEVCREEPAKKENQRSQNEPD